MDYTSLILYIGSGLLIVAIGYIYFYRRAKRDIFRIIGVIIFCYTTAISIPLFIKGVDYGFRGVSFLGPLEAWEIRLILGIACLVMLPFYAYLFYQFMEFIAKRDKKD